jgi:hypothetical protein
VPVAPPVTVSQLRLLEAVHPQPVVVVTATVPLSPPAATVLLIGDTEKLQAPLCVIATA